MSDKKLARVAWGVVIGLLALYAIGMLWGPVTSRVGTAEASPVPAQMAGGTLEVLSETAVGNATVYHILLQRSGFLPFDCVMVQNDAVAAVGGYVAISCD
jgi:hypothetical protein